MSNAYQHINQVYMKNYSSAESERLISKYIAERFEEDMMYKLMLPVVKERVSEDDLRTLAALFSTPEGKEFIALDNKMGELGESPEFLQTMSQAGMAIGHGQKPQAVKLNSNVSASYATLCGAYFDASGADGLVEQMCAGMAQMASSEEEKEMYGQISAYMRDNFKNIFINYAHGIMNEKQLNYGIKVCSMPAQKKMMEALGNYMTNMQSLGMNLLDYYVEWLEAQGVELKEM